MLKQDQILIQCVSIIIRAFGKSDSSFAIGQTVPAHMHV